MQKETMTKLVQAVDECGHRSGCPTDVLAAKVNAAITGGSLLALLAGTAVLDGAEGADVASAFAAAGVELTPMAVEVLDHLRNAMYGARSPVNGGSPA